MTEICDENDKDYKKGDPLGEICFDGVNISKINLQ
jgi:hypothetical protein